MDVVDRGEVRAGAAPSFERVLLVGDTHGNPFWWDKTVVLVAIRLDVDAIVQVGDFGYWPGSMDGDAYLDLVRSGPVPVFFLDGNHDHHPALRAASGWPKREAANLGGNLWYLPRGSRLSLAGAETVALGGARSIDRSMRRAGSSWFPEEEIDDDDLAALGNRRADILLAHDAPSGWPIPGLPPDNALAAAWREERPACEAHRRQVRRAVDVLQPQLVVHGHYHQAYDSVRDEPWGAMRVAGLSEDGTVGAFATLTATASGPQFQRVTLR